MAASVNTRYWGSESTDSRFGRLDIGTVDYEASSNGFKGKNENKKSEKKGVHFFGSKVSFGTKNIRNHTDKDDSCKVKTSALLYEITERVDQLAKPRIRTNSMDATENRADVNKIPMASPRILELSKPKAVYEPPSKPPGFVAPGALTALATERILELSRPKKKMTRAITRKKKLIYSPCSPRILYLARAKNFAKRNTDDRGTSRHRKSDRPSTVIPRWKELVYDVSKHRLGKNVSRERKRSKRQPRSSNSDRTVITIDVDYEAKTRRKSRSSRKGRNAFARRKSSKIKG